MYIHMRYTCRGALGEAWEVLGRPFSSSERSLGVSWGHFVGSAVAFGPLSPKSFEMLICENQIKCKFWIRGARLNVNLGSEDPD